ncbi:MAG: hypothetical protein AABX03_01970 [Nanoarchaeota archaeon]
MAKIPATQNRLFKNAFLCKHCGAKIIVAPKKILDGKVQCRRCKKKSFRAFKRK